MWRSGYSNKSGWKVTIPSALKNLDTFTESMLAMYMQVYLLEEIP